MDPQPSSNVPSPGIGVVHYGEPRPTPGLIPPEFPRVGASGWDFAKGWTKWWRSLLIDFFPWWYPQGPPKRDFSEREAPLGIWK